MNYKIKKYAEFTANINESKNNIDEFEHQLNLLNTLELEDDEVRIPELDLDTDEYWIQVPSENFYLHIRKREELPESGAFEIFILDINDEVVGFIRGTKKDFLISFNLIYIEDEYRGQGLGSSIYKLFLEKGYEIKSDTEITDSTYSLYLKLAKEYTPIIYNDGRVGLKK